MKTKAEINNNLNEISKRLRKIENSIYWYIEIPIKKIISLERKELIDEISGFHYYKDGTNQDYKKGDIFIRKEDWDIIKLKTPKQKQ